MTTALVAVHPRFDASFPFAADDLVCAWPLADPPATVRLPIGSPRRLGEIDSDLAPVTLLVSLGLPVTPACLHRLPALRWAWFDAKGTPPAGLDGELTRRGAVSIRHRDKAYYAGSVAEAALGLVLASLRRIPLMDRRLRARDRDVWTPRPDPAGTLPGGRGEQFADDPRFVNGTLAGKRVRILGAGNIGARFAAMAVGLGADVAVYDPGAPSAVVALTGARRCRSIEELVRDADIFLPMVPRLETTEGLVSAAHVADLPRGALVVLVTRAKVCDMRALRSRVVDGELGLAADVFDVEPLPTDDPLLTLDHVILTPHLAGRTRDTNRAWATMTADRISDCVRENP